MNETPSDTPFPSHKLGIKADISLLRAAWNCFRNFRKWRRARTVSRAIVTLINDGTPEEADAGFALWRINSNMWREIHGQPLQPSASLKGAQG